MNQPDPYQQWLQARRQSPSIDVTQSVLSEIEQEPLKPAPSNPSTLQTRMLFVAQCLAIAGGLLCGFFRLSLLLIPFSSLQ